MKIKKMRSTAPILCALLGLAGCNTISFFPAKAAEKAADKVLDDIIPAAPANGGGAPQSETRSARPAPSSPSPTPLPPRP